jgi:hypothetical protein
MYGKNDGKKNFKNICCFPYPINQTVFYGSCALVASSSGMKINLTVDLWKQIHTFLMSEIPSNINGKSSFSFTNTPSTTKSCKKEIFPSRPKVPIECGPCEDDCSIC